LAAPGKIRYRPLLEKIFLTPMPFVMPRSLSADLSSWLLWTCFPYATAALFSNCPRLRSHSVWLETTSRSPVLLLDWLVSNDIDELNINQDEASILLVTRLHSRRSLHSRTVSQGIPHMWSYDDDAMQ